MMDSGRWAERGLAFYQRWVSPVAHAVNRSLGGAGGCRFQPTCSEYAAAAVARRGLGRGALLAAWRVLRCNPFSRGGYDPVPGERGADGPAGSLFGKDGQRHIP